MNLFEELQTNEIYKELLEQLPPDERPFIEKSLRDLLDQFQNEIIAPLENQNDK